MRRFQVIPRDQSFFDLFEKGSANVADAARLLLQMITEYNDPEADHAEISRREHEGDEITHQIMRTLNT
jgi:uncharacterized protein Yka (UPF0111/DUF47 family)